MDVNELLQQMRNTLTVTRLFGEPHERNGVTVIPVAVVRGGGGGGRCEGPGPEGVGTRSGSGGGFGLTAKSAGVYVIEGNRVSWRPAVDVKRIVLGGQTVAIGCGRRRLRAPAPPSPQRPLRNARRRRTAGRHHPCRKLSSRRGAPVR